MREGKEKAGNKREKVEGKWIQFLRINIHCTVMVAVALSDPKSLETEQVYSALTVTFPRSRVEFTVVAFSWSIFTTPS